MNIVKIDNKYRNINFMNKIITIDSDYLIDLETLEFLENIDKINKDLVHYITYRILNDDTLMPNIYLIPKNGLEFINKKNRLLGLGVYHAHLNNEMVLSWYVEYNDGDYFLKFIYEKHPDSNDSYKKMLKSIYRNNKSYNVFTNKYLIDDIHNTEFNENIYVLNFNEFIKL